MAVFEFPWWARGAAQPTTPEILDVWDLLDTDDVSTERLSMLVCEWFGHVIDDADVATALYLRHMGEVP